MSASFISSLCARPGYLIWVILYLQGACAYVCVQKMGKARSSHCGKAEMNPTRNQDVAVRSLASLRGLRIQHWRELWCRLQTRLGSNVAVDVAVVQASRYSSD